jgi:hypothetical protein
LEALGEPYSSIGSAAILDFMRACSGSFMRKVRVDVNHYPSLTESEVIHQRSVKPILQSVLICTGAIVIAFGGMAYIDYRDSIGVKDSYEPPSRFGTVAEGAVQPENKYLTQVKPEPTIEPSNQGEHHEKNHRNSRSRRW